MCWQCLGLKGRGSSPVHILNKFSTFLVSTLCILAGSTESIGAANLTGMMSGKPKGALCLLCLVSPLGWWRGFRYSGRGRLGWVGGFRGGITQTNSRLWSLPESARIRLVAICKDDVSTIAVGIEWEWRDVFLRIRIISWSVRRVRPVNVE